MYTERDGLNGFLLAYTCEGSGYVQYRNTKKLLNRKDVFLIDCNEYQHYGTAADKWRFKWILFSGKGARAYFSLVNNNSLNVVKVSEKSKLEGLLDMVISMVEGDSLQADMVLASAIMEILTELLLQDNRLLQEDENIKGSREIVEKAVDMIKNRFHEKLTVDRIASELHFSSHYFAHIFKRFTGIGPHEYLTKHRIGISKELLRNSQNPVDRISVEVGFENVNNFIRNFRKYEGMTPLKYRTSRIE